MTFVLTETEVTSEEHDSFITYGICALSCKSGKTVYAFEDISVNKNDVQQLIHKLEEVNITRSYLHYEVMKFIGSI